MYLYSPKSLSHCNLCRERHPRSFINIHVYQRSGVPFLHAASWQTVATDSRWKWRMTILSISIFIIFLTCHSCDYKPVHVIRLHNNINQNMWCLFAGVCPRRPKEKYVRAGEMVALQCPGYRGYDHSDGRLIWTSHTSQEMDLTGDMSSAQQRETGVLVHGRSLVILNASVNHQGNYSCSQG